MTLKKKTSLLSDSRFPTFIRDNPEYDMLRRFLQSYFESLEQEGGASFEINNARENSDVDTTTESYLLRMFQELCPNLPKNIISDKRFLLKHSRELYEKKGTPDSFKMLFRILFNEFISLKYPNENILRASDGIWNQPVAIQVLITSAQTIDVLNLVNKEIITVNGSGLARNFIRQVRYLGNYTYEFKLDKQKNINFNINDTITSDGISGIVLPCPNTIQIIKAGKKFTPGQLIKLDIEGGTGTLAKVLDTTADGGIKKVKIIKFGTGYTSDFSLTISPSKKAINTTHQTQSLVGGANLPLSDNGTGFKEYGFISQTGKLGPEFDYFRDDYVENDYIASIIRQFSTITPPPIDNDGITEDDYAILNINVASVLSYPGFWSNSRGNLSDPLICIQDNDFYQDFSYVIQSSIPREKYIKHVKENVHPAGMKVFSDLLLDNTIDISGVIANIDVAKYNLYINDLIDVPDSRIFHIDSLKSDSIENIEDSLSLGIALSKNDYSLIIEAGGDYFANDYVVEDYVLDVGGVSKDISSTKTDTIEITDNSTKQITKPLFDIVSDNEEVPYVEDGYWFDYTDSPNSLTFTIN